MLNMFLADARYRPDASARGPAYALLSTLTLALGVGGTAAVFAIAKPMMF